MSRGQCAISVAPLLFLLHFPISQVSKVSSLVPARELTLDLRAPVISGFGLAWKEEFRRETAKRALGGRGKNACHAG